MGHFIGITREPVFSPGRVDDDAAILLAVADQLRQGGQTVDVCNAAAARWPTVQRDSVVFTMAQGDAALARLREWEQRGVRVVNSVAGVLNCQRHRTVPLLNAGGVAFPHSLLLESTATAALPEWVAAGAWVKRGDVHATEAGDVTFADNAGSVRDALTRFAERGIVRAVIQRPVPGTVVKFYAVQDAFFHCVPPQRGALPSAQTLAAMRDLGQRAAQLLHVEVYGGDCVVGTDSAVTLIDLNDWPSYAACRSGAAAAIAVHVRGARGDR